MGLHGVLALQRGASEVAVEGCVWLDIAMRNVR